MTVTGKTVEENLKNVKNIDGIDDYYSFFNLHRLMKIFNRVGSSRYYIHCQ